MSRQIKLCTKLDLCDMTYDDHDYDEPVLSAISINVCSYKLLSACIVPFIGGILVIIEHNVWSWR